MYYEGNKKSKELSFKSMEKYIKYGILFINELNNEERFNLIIYKAYFKVADLNSRILLRQFISHKCKDKYKRKEYGNLRKHLDKCYSNYYSINYTRFKWFIAGAIGLFGLLYWLAKNNDDDDYYYDYSSYQTYSRHST